MSLALVSDVEVALGLAPDTLTTTQAAQVQQYLDTISAIINEECGYNFGAVTATIRMQADGNGDLAMPHYEPVTAVASILDYKSQINLSPSPGTGPQVYYWDGIDTVYGLYPRQVVDVTLTYGDTNVPASLKGIAVMAVKRAYQSPKDGLAAKAVGEVTEEYLQRPQGSLYLTDQEREVVAGWEDSETSWVLSVRPDYPDPRDYWKSQYWPNGPWL